MPQEVSGGQYQSGIGAKTANELFRRANEWARANWSSSLPTIDYVEMNPCLLLNSLCVKRFMQGIGVNSVDAILTLNTRWVWHGSSHEGIVGICCDGWQPSRRRRQTPGYGEFFGLTCNISHGYCKGSPHMIIALIVQNGIHTEQPGSHCVVMNPNYDTGPSYCLPVAVVSFGCGHGMTGWRYPCLQ
jgi:hypothetical protein